ncbi:MAG TPA: hypothetical protein VM327_05290, partial [Candidatus Thermoplasmatota archaeon]|nr:hypothetical protein [Candidatus Thermoplasmatota archaeon]
MRAFLSILLVSAAVLAGCASSDRDGDGTVAAVRDPDWATRSIYLGADPAATDFVPDHDHSDPAIHKGFSTPNFEILGHDPLLSAYYRSSAGTSWCGDVAKEGGRRLAVVHSFSTDVALSVIDVTDPKLPSMVGELVLPYDFTYDVAIFEDGRYAVLAGNPDLASDPPPTLLPNGHLPWLGTWRDACGNERPVPAPADGLPHGYSAILVDLSDPAAPTVADFYEYPGGRNVHSVSTAIVDGVRYVATSGLGALPCTLPNVAGNPVPNPLPCEPQVPRYGNLLSHYDFLTVEDTPAGGRLVAQNVYTPTDQTHLDPSLLYLSNGHTDATIEKHPLTNQTLAYLADWDGGLHIVRLDGAGQTSPIASWGAAPGGDNTQMTGNIHSVRPVEGLRNGKHLLVVGQEVIGRPAGRPSGQVAILDITNPATPLRVAKWTLPVEVQWGPALGETFSTHYPVLVDDTLFVSMYHAGVWAADFSKANWPDLPSVGVYLPSEEPAGEPHRAGQAPEVLEVLALGGDDLLVFDGNSG